MKAALQSFSYVIAMALLIPLSSCGNRDTSADADQNNNTQSAPTITVPFEFEANEHGWSTGAIGYRSPVEAGLGIRGEIRSLPPGVGEGKGFFLESNVFSPTFLFYMQKSLGPEEGLEPQRAYSVRFRIRFATSASQRCLGPGGSPGAANIVAAARNEEPERVLDNSGEWRFDFERSELAYVAEAGYQGECDGEFRAVGAELANPIMVQTKEDGRVWLILGVSPTALATHSLYFDRIELSLTPQ